MLECPIIRITDSMGTPMSTFFWLNLTASLYTLNLYPRLKEETNGRCLCHFFLRR